MFFSRFLLLLVLLGVVRLGRFEKSIPAPTCSQPFAPSNGYVTVSSRNLTIGSKVEVGCMMGYFRTGTPPFVMTCKEDGQWSDVNIKCIARSCGDPGTPRNGRRLGLQFRYLDTVRFSCNHGYMLQGPSSRQCQYNQTWSVTQPFCTPVSCGEPPNVQNSISRVYGQSNEYVYGNKVLYTCRPGFKRLGGDFISCGEDAQWHGAVPYCTEVNCPKLATPANGRLIAGSNYTKERGRVRYQCHAGYMMFGPQIRTCLKSGRWSGPEPICFKCSEVGTRVFVRQLFYFRQGVVLSKSGNTVTVHYDNDEEEDVIILGPGTQHYVLVQDRVPSSNEIFIGSRVLAFNPLTGRFTFATVSFIKGKGFAVRYDGKWYKVAAIGLQNIRTLEPPRFCATCKDLGRPPHSSREDDLTEFIPGMEATYTCHYTFKMSGSETRRCLSNGSWTGSEVACTPFSCDDLDAFPPKNGARLGNNFTIGSTVEFTCKEGFSLVGQKYLKCLPTGKWSDLPPTCQSACENYRCASPGKKCTYDKKLGRRCVCRRNLDCPALFDPVCGSDGVSYNSYCIMSATACRTGQNITMVGRGHCEPAGLCQIVPYSVCRASFHRFFYNSTSTKCQPIIAGGCHASGWNGFVTESQCKLKCLVEVCKQPVSSGPCSHLIKRWFFDSSSGKCQKFKYSGCYGNENNFASKKICLQRCQSANKDSRLQCKQCPHVKVRKVCKQSSLAVIAKVISRLPSDVQKQLLRYAIDIQYVLKNTSQSIPEGRVVVSIPYKLALNSPSKSCACPRLPLKKKFILIGRATNSLDQSKMGFIVDRTAFVAGWSLGVRRQIKLKCTGHVTIPNHIS